MITAIDVGTTKICTFIAEPLEDGRLQLLGAGVARSRGLRRGVIVNVSAATEAITEAIEKAEQDAGRRVENAYVGIVGKHITSHNSKGAVAIPRGRSITRQDVDRALDAARAIPLAEDREIIHVIARNFTVDEQAGVQEPVGMHGYRLEVNAHVITGARAPINNLIKCIEGNGVTVNEVVLEPLASGEAILTPEEREMGVVVADIGGGTTDVAIYIEGSVWHTVILEIGGDLLTRDLAMGLRTPYNTAERLKLRYGHALPTAIPEDELINTHGFGENNTQAASRRFLAEILEARGEEILQMILREINRSGYDSILSAGVVLTGGSSLLPGFKELAQDILRLPIRVGVPGSVLNVPRQYHSPAYATGIGLLLWAHRQDDVYETTRQPSAAGQSRIRQWLRALLPG